jgi:hypothetical protein
MYACSSAFTNAVRNGNDQKALLIFDDCVFTDDDINVSNGIRFNDYFNTEEDISIGQATSNEISFSLFNDDRLLNDYAFGDFVATLGVQIGEGTYQQFSPVIIQSSYTGANYEGRDESPFIKRNGSALSSQPSFPVKSILIYDGKVWCFSNDGRFAVYKDSDGSNISSRNRLNAFMKQKSKGWDGKGICYNKNTRMLVINENGTRREYEFVPLGVFTADRPNAPDKIQIDMTCYDQMQKFEDDMPSDSALGISWPCTIGRLYEKLCDYVGVKYETSSFINSTALVMKRPADFDNATMRDVIKWIAEAAGSNARFNRDGILQLAWLKSTSQSYEATAYSEFNPYWYETKKVTKLYNRDTQNCRDNTYGSGGEAYLIQDNPLLRGVS